MLYALLLSTYIHFVYLWMEKREYLESVGKYKPIGPWLWNGEPLFVVSVGCSKPLTSVSVINLLFILLILGLLKYGGEDSRVYILIDIITLFFFNLSYLLAQFLNPGILYRPQITGFEDKMYEKCGVCNMFYCEKDGEEHCRDCGVCVYGMDHHCAWFQRCISGPSRFGFYLFLLATFGMVIAFMGSFVGISTGQ